MEEHYATSRGRGVRIVKTEGPGGEGNLEPYPFPRFTGLGDGHARCREDSLGKEEAPAGPFGIAAFKNRLLLG